MTKSDHKILESIGFTFAQSVGIAHMSVRAVMIYFKYTDAPMYDVTMYDLVDGQKIILPSITTIEQLVALVKAIRGIRPLDGRILKAEAFVAPELISDHRIRNAEDEVYRSLCHHIVDALPREDLYKVFRLTRTSCFRGSNDILTRLTAELTIPDSSLEGVEL